MSGSPSRVSASVVVPTLAPAHLESLLASVADQTEPCELVVADNSGTLRAAQIELEGVDVQLVQFGANLGFGSAVNRAAERASGDLLLLTNDDCVLAPDYVEEMTSAFQAGAGQEMIAGTLLTASDTEIVDSAGVEIDRTLMAFDHFHGESLADLREDPGSPLGPTGGAAGFDRRAFLEQGGFDEEFFAYLEDVDLALRMRLEGVGVRSAPKACAVHAHSATLGSGSSAKNHLMGFGRGYMLRKWSVLSPRRAPSVLAREIAICAGQLAIDRNAAGAAGRFAGYRRARRRFAFPSPFVERSAVAGPRFGQRLRRRLAARGSSEGPE